VRAWGGIGAAGDGAAVYDALVSAYREPQRGYHSLQHLRECLGLFEQARGLASRAGEVEIALWFHDAVYDVRRTDNEERSAEWSRVACTGDGVASTVVERVHSLVMVTKHTGVPACGDEQLLVDIDLAILGAPEQRFAEYERQIREEYAYVPEALFAEKRRFILLSFLKREHLYGTSYFRARFEAVARANLEAALAKNVA